MSCSPREMAGYFHGIVSSTSALVSTESAGFVREQTSYVNYMRTSFNSFRCWAGYTRKAMIATNLPPYSPRQTSLTSPNATAVSPCLSSPAERTVEVGSRSVALQAFPKAATNLTLRELTVGYNFVEVMVRRFQGRRMNHLNIPYQLFPGVLSDLPALVPEC